MLLQEIGGSNCCFNVKAKHVETTDQRKGFFLIFICKGYHNGSIVLHADAGCLQCLVEGTVQTLVIADGLTG